MALVSCVDELKRWLKLLPSLNRCQVGNALLCCDAGGLRGGKVALGVEGM